MVLDEELVLAEAQTVTVDAYSDNVIDLGAGGARGKDLVLVARVDTTFDTAEEDGTLQIKVQTDGTLDGEGGIVGDLLAGEDLIMSPEIAEAELVADAIVFKCKLPKDLQRYLQVYLEVGSHAFTAGKIDLFIVPDAQQLQA